MAHQLEQIIAREDGQTSVEYALVVLLIALAVSAFGLALNGVLDNTINAALDFLS